MMHLTINKTRESLKELAYELVCANPGWDAEDISNRMRESVCLMLELTGELLLEGRLEFAQ